MPRQLSRHTKSQKKRISGLNQSNQMTQSTRVFYPVGQLHMVARQKVINISRQVKESIFSKYYELYFFEPLSTQVIDG